MKQVLILIIMTFAMLSTTSMASVAAEPFTVINAHKLKVMLDQKEPATVVIDSRGKADYDQAHIAGAISLPLSQMAATPGQLGSPGETRLAFYCSGST